MNVSFVTDTGVPLGTLTLTDGDALPSVGDYAFLASGGEVYKVVNRFFSHAGTTLAVFVQVTDTATTTASYGL